MGIFEKTTLSCDVLVIGGGGAALRAAIAAVEAGADVLLASKGLVGKSGATWHAVSEVGAFNVPDGAGDPSDSPRVFYEDIVKAAQGAADPKLCRILTESAQAAMLYLERFSDGSIFEKSNGGYNTFQACFSSKPRSHIILNHFRPLMKVLDARANKLGIKRINGIAFTRLLVTDGICCGARGVTTEGCAITVLAGSVILATGGATTLFSRNMYPDDITGDGYAMAYDAGAQLANMEFIQMGIGVAEPFVNLFGNYLWECLPKIASTDGAPLLTKYLPPPMDEKEVMRAKKRHFPFSVSDCSKYIEIAVQSEINREIQKADKTALLCFNETDAKKTFSTGSLAKMWQHTHKWFADKGIDLFRQPLRIACFAHAMNGGVLIDGNAQSSIPGLFAAGETAAGPHGADRLGGNMSVACQVFGKIAGEQAAAFSKINGNRKKRANVQADDEYEELLEQMKSTGSSAERLLDHLKDESVKALLIVRNEPELINYLGVLKDVRDSLLHEARQSDMTERIKVLEVLNLVKAGKLIAEAALFRKESRGSHYRMDYPDKIEEYEGMALICGDSIGIKKIS